MAADTPHAEGLVAGKYELVEAAGEGGMATVFRGLMHGAAGFARPVAIKRIKSDFKAHKNYVDMFVEEARVGSELNHPNIVQAYDFCSDESGHYYLVMEWVEGVDLGGLIHGFKQTSTPTPWPVMTAIVFDALRGLAAAHGRVRPDGTRAPVIHRDVSPHNILVSLHGGSKLSDFGLARARDRVFSLTAPGKVKGKISYLSPEVARGREASMQSDIFAMGTVLWEALAARRLFEGTSDIEIFKQIHGGEIRKLEEFREHLPERLVRAVHRALAVEEKDRFQTAREMAIELGESLREHPSAFDISSNVGAAVRWAREQLGIETDPARAQTSWSIDIDFSSIDYQKGS